MNVKLTEIAGKHTTVKLEQADVNALAIAVSDMSSTKKLELDEIASAIKDVRDKIDDPKFDEVVESNKKVLEKLEGVKGMSDALTVGLTRLEKIFEKDVFTNVATHSEQSVSALNSLNGHMVTLITKFDGIPKATNVENTAEHETNVEATKTAEKEVPRQRKKCKFFSSSVALGCDKKKLEYELGCDVEMVETYHIIENPTAPNPEKFLKNMLELHLKPKEVDFIIISVGSNDITFLNNDKNSLTLNQEAIEHSNKLVHLATGVAAKHGIEVFVTERPARYDKREKDPKGVKSVINESANGMLIALTSVLEKVHTIKLPALENLHEKSRKALYKNDGVHLTNAGLAVLEDSLVAGIKNILTDVDQDEDRSNDPISTPQPGSGDDGRPQRGNGSRNGYGPPDHDRRGGGARGQRYHDDRQQQYGRPPQQRYRNNRNGGDRQEHGMLDMMRDFMAFMNNGQGRYRSRY